MTSDWILQLIAEFLFSEGMRRVGSLLKQKRTRIRTRNREHNINSSSFGVARRVEFVNRETEKQAIRLALSEANQLRILCFSAPGGVGKTRLLQEVERLAKSVRTKPPLKWGGIIDLYHVDLWEGFALKKEIISRLDPSKQYFGSYLEALELYERRRTAGARRGMAERRQALDELFIADYNNYSSYRKFCAIRAKTAQK